MMATLPKTPIQTIVFFDLEATGLTRPRITELSLLSVQREEFLTRNGSPRVVNKLTLCVDPQKPISPVASNMTGLYNDSLEFQTPFDNKVVDTMALFLSRLPPPVCLVAHYGNGFDYPLLNAELNRAKCELPVEVVCIDSLDAIRAIDTHTLYEEERQRIDIQNKNNSTPTNQGIQSGQLVQPNYSTAPQLQPHPTYTATVTQDTMLAKRKANAESIEHVRKKLFTDADKEAKEEGSNENKTTVEMIKKQAVEVTGQLPVLQNLPEIKTQTAAVPSQNTPEQPKAEDEDVGQSIAASLVLDSQQSVTDDMLMQALDCVEANENSEKAGTSFKKCPSSASNVVTQSTSPPQTRTLSPDKVCNNGFLSAQPAQPSAGDTGGCTIPVDQLNTPVKSCVNNNTPVSTGVNNSGTDQDQINAIVLPKLSYKLEEIYYRTFGEKPPLSHNAEDDCVTLMKVCKKRCPQFLEWINKHQVLLSTLPPMY